jgi:4-amino-4-deoxy-L-arabinose transferase-like glycosyltransferase
LATNIITALNLQPKAIAANTIALLKANKMLLLLTVILLIGFTARLWAIDFGLPFPYHMEEPFYTEAARNLACKGDLDSSLLQSHTYLFALSIAVSQFFQTTASCAAPSAPIAPLLLLMGRLVSVVAGTVTIGVVYQLGKSLFNTQVGMLGALFIGLNFLHTRESHYGTPDTTTVLLVTSCFLAYIAIAGKAAPTRHYVAASVLTALSINGRPTAILLVLPFLYAYLYSRDLFQKPSWQALRDAMLAPVAWLCIGVTTLTLILVNPRLFVNPIGFLRYWRSFLALGQSGGFGLLQVDPLPAPLFYLRAIEWGSGLLLAAVAGVGVLWAVRRRTFGDILLLAYILPYFALAATSSVYFGRYIIPILPLLGLLAARFAWDVLPRGRRIAWVAVVVALLLIQPVERIVRYNFLLTQTDTRTLAQRWIDSNIPKGTKIASEWHAAPIEGYDLDVVDFYGLSVRDVEFYRREKYEYLVVSSFIRDNVMFKLEEEARKRCFYVSLAQHADLVYEVKPYSGQNRPQYVIDQSLGPITALGAFDRPGPTVEVYQLKQPASDTQPASADCHLTLKQ